jgi:nucleoside-diphosphate-sugar epimerase
MKAIIGTGQLGLALMDALLSDNPNEEILLVNRTGKLKRLLPANVQLMAADATNKHKVEFICRDAEVVFSCTDVPYQSWSTFYPAISSALAYALSKTNARLVFADNMYSYGNVAGKPMTELLPHSAKTKKGKIRAAVIKALLYSAQPFSSRVAIVKAADFIGPRIHKGIFGTDFLDKLYSDKAISLFGDPELAHTFTYINDFARTMVNVGNAPDASGQIWHAPNATAISPTAWIKLFEQQSGKTARVMHMPKVLVRIAGLFNTLARELYELAYQFESPYLVEHEKYTARFGNHFTDHETIVAETISWYISGKPL